MIFAIRGIAVSLAVFALAYGLLSCAVAFGWKLAARVRRLPANADLLFGLRMLPLTVAVLVAGVFVVPSFLFLEPRSVHEPIGAVPFGLSFCSIALLVAGWSRAAAGLRKTSRMVAEWMKGSTISGLKAAFPLVRVRGAAPALAVVGIRHPRVLISDDAAALLTKAEFQAALRHEVAHVRRRDNLKKLLFQVCAFPGMAPLEVAWREASETAADEAAVTSSNQAVDLAAALIKLARLGAGPAADFSTALIDSSRVAARVERLMAWDETRRFSFAYVMVPILATFGAGMMVYGTMLAHTHALTEWLVR